MSRRTWLSAAVVFMLALTAAPSPAAASATLPWPGRPICAEGTLTAGPRTNTDPVRTPLAFSIQACEGTDPATLAAGSWGVAIFETYNSWTGRGRSLVPAHGSPWTGEAVGFRDNGLALEPWGTVRAVCLNTGHTVRVACVRVDAVGAAGTIVMTPIAVTDPLVDRFVAIPPPDPNGPYTNPECVGCL